MEEILETGFAIDIIRYGIPVALISIALYTYKKNKLGAYIVSLITMMMWGLSAFMNMWTGWLVGGVVSNYGALFGALFMLITEFIVPASLIYSRTTNHSLPLVVVTSIVMAVGLSIFSFWNGTALSLNTHFANMLKSGTNAESISTRIDATKTSEKSLTITPEQSVQPLLNKIAQIENKQARNLAGNPAYRNGRRLTVKSATNNCTSGVYYNNPKLYKNDCAEIKRLKQQVATVRRNNTTISTNIDNTVALQLQRADLINDLSEEQYKQNTTMPLIAIT